MAKLRPDLFAEVATSQGLEEAERCWQDFENGWRPEGWD